VTDKQRTPGAGFFATICVVALMSYPLSIGPACWASSRVGGAGVVTVVYRPVIALVGTGKTDGLAYAVEWYSAVLSAGGWHWWHPYIVDVPLDGSEWIWEHFGAPSGSHFFNRKP
jgi:hypothetical protein